MKTGYYFRRSFLYLISKTTQNAYTNMLTILNILNHFRFILFYICSYTNNREEYLYNATYCFLCVSGMHSFNKQLR